VLGDLSSVRDWSFAGDIMFGAWLMLQQDRASDYILASGVGRTVEEFAEVAFAKVGLEASNHIRLDPTLRRTPEPTARVGDPSYARSRLGWRQSMTFDQLVHRMVDADLRALSATARST